MAPLSLNAKAEFLFISLFFIFFSCTSNLPSPTQSTQNPLSLGPYPVNPNRIQTDSIFHAATARLAFVNTLVDTPFNHSILSVIEYGPAGTKRVQFSDFYSVYFPSFSPDGQFIAFCTAPWETPDSRVYIRSTMDSTLPAIPIDAFPAFAPTWWVDRTTCDTFLVFTNGNGQNSDPAWEKTATFQQKVSGGIPIGEAKAIYTRGSLYGGRSDNGRYIATGYPHLLICDTQRDSLFQLFQYPQTGKEFEGSSQVCNLSMSPGASQVLFLDLGCESISRLTGSTYVLHEYIFIASVPDGKITKFFRMPEGAVEWQNCKWSNKAEFAVACIVDTERKRPKVYAINLTNSTYTCLATGEFFLQPALWIGASQ